MKLRDAKRSFAHSCKHNPVLINPFLFLVSFNIILTFDHKRRLYRCKFYSGELVHFRINSCAKKLILIVYTELTERMAQLQGQSIIQANPRNSDLLTKIVSGLAPGITIKASYGYGSISKLTPVRRDPSLVKILDEALQNFPDQSAVLAAKENYINSSRVTDPELVAPAFNKLAQKPPKETNREVVKQCFFLRCIKDRSEVKRVEFSPSTMAAVPFNEGSASGIIPVRPVRGLATLTQGKKRDLHTSAVSVNVAVRIGSQVPCVLPNKPFLKEEVIKIGKAVRGIQNESFCNYIINDHCFTQDKKFGIGNAIGIGSQVNGYLMPLIRWFMIYRKYVDNSWVNFLDFLEITGAHESDKTAWEASTNANDGLPALLMDVLSVRADDAGDRRLLVRALADYYNPAIYLDRSVFYAPFRVASGTRRTASGNTERHMSMNWWLCYFVRSHGYRMGTPGCTCFVCGDLVLSCSEVTAFQIELREHAYVLGDDYWAVSWGEDLDREFDIVMDHVFGTTTKTVTTRFFGDEGADQCGEFLRRSYKRVGDRVFIFRKSERVLAKLYHGSFLLSPSRLAAALTSLKFEIGYNKALHCLIDEVMGKIQDRIDAAEYQEELNKFNRRNPAIGDMQFFYGFTMEDVLNCNSQIADSVIQMFKRVNRF